ncbi:MAG TPA: hypothetical protein VNP96_10610 [Solirubrobacterales bacterium]|nr:hypothetical protein [Solirubrobacterales bacterium]
MLEFLLPALPLLLLVGSLVLGRYPGLDAAIRLADRIGSWAGIRVATAVSSNRPRRPDAGAAHGGLLLAFSIAGRAPPA